MRLWLPKQQDNNEKAKVPKSANLPENGEDIKEVFQYQNLAYISEIIHFKVINYHHNDPVVRYFGIDKIQELVTKKYYWPILRHNIKTYVKKCNIYLASKAVCHKPYKDL